MFINTVLVNSFSKIINPAWLTGPIFDKELRVSSRRKRNYVLRFAYITLLTLFVVLVWAGMARFQGARAYQISRMSEAGLAIVSTVIVFQFIATQLIAVVMLSTSISDEIYNRTLGVLMTTPINSFQIVMGKLFSKILQLILLLAISLPLLTIVRVFGGVPWGYVLSSLSITLTAVIFAGSLSLYFSISGRRAYAVILKTIFTLGALYAIIPSTIVLIFQSLFFQGMPGPTEIIGSVLILPNPFASMQFNTIMMLSPGMAGGLPFFSWPLHCAIMIGLSSLLLARSVRIVRKIALRQAAGQMNLKTRAKRTRKQNEQPGKTSQSQASAGTIRPVKGSPVIWKELRTPLIQGGKGKNIIGLAITITVLLVMYAINSREGVLDEDFTHMTYTLIFFLIGLLANIVLSATTITSEKETRSWPILLTTSMDDWQILIGKTVGVFRKCLPVWLLLAGHLFIFVSAGYIHPIAVVHLAMLISWVVIFLSGSGLYFSARLKRTTSAVVANFALALTLWAIIPLLLTLVAEISYDDDLLLADLSTNPVIQACVIMDGAGGSQNAKSSLSHLNYEWPNGNKYRNVWPTTGILLITMLAYISLGALFAWRAKCRFRRNIF